MAKKRRVRDLYVFMNEERVGVLNYNATGKLCFQYDEQWLSSPRQRPISLSMPLQEAPYTGNLVENYFDNLLPDNERIRRRIQTRFQTRSTKCFDLLAEIGADCVGALQILSEHTAILSKTIQAEPINNAGIAQLLKQYKTAPLGMQPDTEFRISIAGAQEKTALLWHNNQWHLPYGTTPTSHIIKLPIGYIEHTGMDLSDSVENEWLCLQILAAYQLPVNNARIQKFEDTSTLVVERFDRHWTNNHANLMRLPQEDFCQALGIFSDLKYQSDGGPGIEQIMFLLRGSRNTHADQMQFMKSVFLFWILAAIDGHAKNFSIFLEPGGRYSLTPLYDVMSAYPLLIRQQLNSRKIKMAMSVKDRNNHYHWRNIALRHWYATAKRVDFPEQAVKQIIEQTFDEMESVIEQVGNALPADFPEVIAKSIFHYMRKAKNQWQPKA